MIELRPWSNDDLPVLFKTVGDAAMMEHLGGVETPDQIVARHRRYLERPLEGGMFTISLAEEVVGTVGFWRTTWRAEPILEAGWQVFSEFWGRGIASRAASAIVSRAKAGAGRRFLHAFPAVTNAASNAVCRNAGFSSLGECTFEYPQGRFMQCNDWCVDLSKRVETLQ